VIELRAVFHQETFDAGEFIGLRWQHHNIKFYVRKVLTR
jgi:hypothetical protein